MHGILSRPPARATTAIVGAALACLWLGACHSQDHPEEEVVPPPEVQEAREIAPGENIVVEFPVDDHWHKSGYLVVAGDKITCRPVGPARRLTDKALVMHIGRARPMIVKSMSGIRISLGGEIAFQGLSKYAPGFDDQMARIQIRCLREPEDEDAWESAAPKKLPYRDLDD